MNTKKNDWNHQISKGVFEVAILILVSQQPRYGYEITKKLQEGSVLQLANGSIYPILKRLLKNGWVNSYSKEHEGRSRKYYTLTTLGSEILNKRLVLYKDLYCFLLSLEKGET